MEKYLNQIESSDAYNRLHNCFSEFIERENCLEIEKTKGKNTQYVYRIEINFEEKYKTQRLIFESNKYFSKIESKNECALKVLKALISDRKFPQMVCFKIFLRKIYSIYLKAA
jgi:hypothetical protein